MNLDPSVLYCKPWGRLKWVYLPPFESWHMCRNIHTPLSPSSVCWLSGTGSSNCLLLNPSLGFGWAWGLRSQETPGELSLFSRSELGSSRTLHEAKCSPNQQFIYEYWAVSRTGHFCLMVLYSGQKDKQKDHQYHFSWLQVLCTLADT